MLESKNKFSSIHILKKEKSFPKTYSYFSTLSNSITTHFFEWTPEYDVSGEKKRVVSAAPNMKICYDFFASTQKADIQKKS